MNDSPGIPHGSDSHVPAYTEGSALHEAIRTLTSNLSLEMVLRQVADLSRELVSASYSVLGIMGDDGTLVQFITSGISQGHRDRAHCRCARESWVWCVGRGSPFVWPT